MPHYSYIALDNSGAEVSGRVQADDMGAANLMLRQRGLRVMELQERNRKEGFLGQANFSDWLASQRSVGNASMIFSSARWRSCCAPVFPSRRPWSWLRNRFRAPGSI
nr:hypothetical protein [Methylomarinum sp. Ch1-1]MDP4521735.1 hypothetical protein [Methylomarinum sp. Ch1-1]